MLVAEEQLRDYAVGQDVEVELGESSQVFIQCLGSGDLDPYDRPKRWTPVRAVLSNANPGPISFRIMLGWPSDFEFRGLPHIRLKDGEMIAEVSVPGIGRREVTWQVKPVEED
jgi:hypothetical protein